MQFAKPYTLKDSGAWILIVDDDDGMCYTLTRMVQEEGHQAEAVGTLKEGLALAASGKFDVVFLDVRLPDGSGISTVPQLQAMNYAPEIIIITGFGDQGGAKAALKSGVWDYIEKPARINDLKLSLKRALQYRRQKKTVEEPFAFDRCGIIGHSSKLFMCLVLMSHAAKTDANVLIGGETGTGKELFARAIHTNCARAAQPFVVVDCAALPQTLAESILFGHVRGAFTGADKASPGLIKKADGGTLFLDEVGELPWVLQKTLLRVLQEKKFLPVGGQDEVRSNFRLISATNQDLESAVGKGSFRQDLFYRLRTFMIELPTLRNRKKDIPEIVSGWAQKLCKDSGQPPKALSDEFIEVLTGYDWPGNVRELINAVESALAMEPGCPTLYPKHLPEYIRALNIRGEENIGHDRQVADAFFQWNRSKGVPTLKHFRSQAIEAVETHYLERLMDACGGDLDRACNVSGLKRARLYQLLKKYNIHKME